MSHDDLLDIDGAHGEGGGQLLRTALALAVLAGRRVRLANIRGNRPKPGLAAQHLTAVQALAEICGGRVHGLALGARELLFEPGAVRGGTFRFDVGTAGSIALVLQAVLPVAIFARQAFSLHIRGGTDVRGAPPMDYLRHVLLPLLQRMGASLQIDVVRRGYYPQGGGEVRVEVPANPPLRPLRLDRQGRLCAIHGRVHVANLPGHVATRMARAASAVLAAAGVGEPHIALDVLGPDAAVGPGGGIVLAATWEHTVLGSSALAQRGVPAERLGEAAARSLLAEIRAGATLDVHAADQMLVYFALAGGLSRFRARELSSHAETTLWLIERFFPLRVSRAAQAGAVLVSLERV